MTRIHWVDCKESEFCYMVKLGKLPDICICDDCGQFDIGQTGEHPCKSCGLPIIWDDCKERYIAINNLMIDKSSKYKGYTHKVPMWLLWLWRIVFCAQGWHAWDEIDSLEEHCLYCDACDETVNIL